MSALGSPGLRAKPETPRIRHRDSGVEQLGRGEGQRAFAHVVREPLPGARSPGARLATAAELGEEVAAHGRQEVVVFECRLGSQRVGEFEMGSVSPLESRSMDAFSWAVSISCRMFTIKSFQIRPASGRLWKTSRKDAGFA
jgi:hypothetical protein